MNRLFALLALAFPLVARAQETTNDDVHARFLFLTYGLVGFLALVGVYSIVEKIRDRLEDNKNRAEEEARKLKMDNIEREEKL